MKVQELFERAPDQVAPRDINRFSKGHEWDDIDSDHIDPDLFEDFYRKIKQYIRGGKLNIFRAYSVFGDPIAELERNNTLGQFWSYDPTTVDTYRSAGPEDAYEDDYVIHSRVDERHIDWEATFALNMTPSRGNYEREVRLFKGTPLKIVNLYAKDGQNITPVELGPLANKMFKVRRKNSGNPRY